MQTASPFCAARTTTALASYRAELAARPKSNGGRLDKRVKLSLEPAPPARSRATTAVRPAPLARRRCETVGDRRETSKIGLPPTGQPELRLHLRPLPTTVTVTTVSHYRDSVAVS
jgi:hypothetical protein